MKGHRVHSTAIGSWIDTTNDLTTIYGRPTASSEIDLASGSFNTKILTGRRLSTALKTETGLLFSLSEPELARISRNASAARHLVTLSNRNLCFLTPISGTLFPVNCMLWSTIDSDSFHATNWFPFSTAVFFLESVLLTTSVDPIPAWACGMQLVPIPWPVKGMGSLLNTTLFEQNGNCGYVPKPKSFATSGESNPTATHEPPIELFLSVR